MKFTHLFIAGAVLLAAGSLASCGGDKKAAEAENTDTVVVMAVNEVLANPAALVGDTITVSGECSHLCKHGGTKAFLTNPDTTAATSVLLCRATEQIGGAFDPSCPGKTLVVKGVVTPNEITKSRLDALAAKAAAEKEANKEADHCDNEAKSGNDPLVLKAKMDSMAAANPADTTLTVGYFIETLSYELPQE